MRIIKDIDKVIKNARDAENYMDLGVMDKIAMELSRRIDRNQYILIDLIVSLRRNGISLVGLYSSIDNDRIRQNFQSILHNGCHKGSLSVAKMTRCEYTNLMNEQIPLDSQFCSEHGVGKSKRIGAIIEFIIGDTKLLEKYVSAFIKSEYLEYWISYSESRGLDIKTSFSKLFKRINKVDIFNSSQDNKSAGVNEKLFIANVILSNCLSLDGLDHSSVTKFLYDNIKTLRSMSVSKGNDAFWLNVNNYIYTGNEDFKALGHNIKIHNAMSMLNSIAESLSKISPNKDHVLRFFNISDEIIENLGLDLGLATELTKKLVLDYKCSTIVSEIGRHPTTDLLLGKDYGSGEFEEYNVKRLECLVKNNQYSSINEDIYLAMSSDVSKDYFVEAVRSLINMSVIQHLDIDTIYRLSVVGVPCSASSYEYYRMKNYHAVWVRPRGLSEIFSKDVCDFIKINNKTKEIDLEIKWI